MHEVSLCESIIELIEEQAIMQGFCRVVAIELEIGRLSCAEPEAMRFAFASVASGSMADGASLRIARPDGEAWCARCETLVTIRQRYDPCPVCGACPLEIRSGEEMRIVQLEVC